MKNEESTAQRIQAYHAATGRLKDKYREEFESIHTEERIKRGLPPEKVSLTALQSENARLRARLEELER